MPAGDEPGDVGHVDEEDRADLAGDLGEPVEVDDRADRRWRRRGSASACARGPARRACRSRSARSWGRRRSRSVVIPAAREVQLHAVRQVAALGEVHRQDGVADLQRGEVDGLVGRRARVRLDVGVLGAEELPWRGRWRAARPCRRTRSRRSSACPGSPSAYLFVRTDPTASMTAALV